VPASCSLCNDATARPPARAPLSSTPLHPPGDAPLRSPLSPASHPPEQRATVLRCSRRTGAKYNREAPRLMSRPNKAKNRPLNNARCNVGAAARREMHGKGRCFFRNFESRVCRESLSRRGREIRFLCSHRFFFFFYPSFSPSNSKNDGIPCEENAHTKISKN